MRYFQTVKTEEMERCVQMTRDVLVDMQPGFRLLTDLTGLVAMEPACAVYVEEIMELCDEKHVGEVVRVIPDPTKDIGFTIMSRFHYSPTVELRTCDNLADAMQSLRLDVPGPGR